MKTIFPGCSYDDILEMTNLPTLHDRRTRLCRAYFNKMNRSNHNALLPGRRTVPYALGSSNGIPVPSVKTNRYKTTHLYRGVYQTTRTAQGLKTCNEPRFKLIY